MTASTPRPVRHASPWVCLLALATLLPGCDEGTRHKLLARDAPGDFSGTWREVLTGTGNSCGFPGVENGEHIVTITQVGTDATLDCVDLCGGAFCHLGGTVSGPTLTSTFSNSSLSEYLFCFDNFEFTLAGTLHMDTVQGSITQRYFRAGVLCPSELHTDCAITYAFEWTRCPPADCTIQECSATSPVRPSSGHPNWGP